MTKPKPKTFSSVWDAISDIPEQAANLQARAELMRQIAVIIKAKEGLEAGRCCNPLRRHPASHQ